MRCDVAVAGGGPAGSACAAFLRLNFPQWTVAVFEASDYSCPRTGEILPPHALSLLRRLQIPLESLEACGTTGETAASAWGGERLHSQHRLFSARGPGLHLDRNRFDRHLAESSADLGTEVFRNTRIIAAGREDGGWRLELNGRRTCRAGFLVDATGRTAAIARLQGAHMRSFDSLTAYSGIFESAPAREAGITIEACAMGWWYTAPLPHGRRIVTFLTDADLGRGAGLPAARAWNDLLRQTQHIAAALGRHAQPSRFLVAPASTSLLSPLGGDGWVAAGDSAGACDPLAGQGITRALYTGMLAACVVADALEGRAAAGLGRYEALMREQFSEFRRLHGEVYAQEQRWSAEPFWQRRHIANNAEEVA